MDQPPDSDQRKYFRLKYPVAERPVIRSEDREFEVSEISEGGARIVVAGQGSFEPGQPFSGTILFADGEEVDIRGIVLRHYTDEIAVRLSVGISFKRTSQSDANHGLGDSPHAIGSWPADPSIQADTPAR